MSMGFLVNPEKAVVWRGPMVMGAIEKMAHGTLWGDVDVLVVDLPPGTGDIHLSIAQTVNVQGAIIVSTPQKVALADAKKATEMLKAVEIPIFGLVENMSGFTCPSCNTTTHIFKGSAAKNLLDLPILGSVPLEVEIMRNSDEGSPIMVANPGSKSASIYQEISEKILAFIK